jgi:hypothetical protein
MAGINESLQEMGVPLDHKDLDWGEGSKTYAELQKRILKSAAKIKKSQDADVKKLQDENAKLKRQLAGEVDSVETSIGVGVSLNGIPSNMAAFKKWYKGLTPAEAKAKEKEINAALDSGRIK